MASPISEDTTKLPDDLQRTGRLAAQKGNLDGGSKPSSTLAQVLNKGLLGQREKDEKSLISLRRPHKAGTGYGIYEGPCRPASWSPCETALLQGRRDWKVTQSEQVTHAEAKLHTDKLEIGKKYKCKISSRFQPLDTTASNYYFQVPTTRQNMKYSNNQEDDASPRTQRARKMAADAQKAVEMKKPLLAQLRRPTDQGDSRSSLTRPRPGIGYDIHRLEEWFKLIDTNQSGEITVRKLIIAMMRYQDIMDLIYLLKEKSSGIWQLKPAERPTAGKLTREDMQWVRGILTELGSDGHTKMCWTEFVEFFRQSGLLMEYETRSDLNTSSLGETNLVEYLKKQEDEERSFQNMFFNDQRRGAMIQSRRRSSLAQRESCALAQIT